VRKSFSYLVACLMVLALGGGFSAHAGVLQLITNGGFATGDLTGWSEFDQAGGSGSWFVSSTTTSPLSGFADPGPDGGTYFALTDQTGPGSHMLIQSFTVPLGTTDIDLSFDMFSDDQDGGPFCGSTDYTVTPTQCARVDILTAGAGPFDLGGSVVDNLYDSASTVTEGPNPWVSYNFDLTGVLTPGDTYQLRFAETDNQDFFQQGVDNVSILATVSPEPASLLLFGTGMLGLGLLRKKKLSKS